MYLNVGEERVLAEPRTLRSSGRQRLAFTSGARHLQRLRPPITPEISGQSLCEGDFRNSL